MKPEIIWLLYSIFRIVFANAVADMMLFCPRPRKDQGWKE